MSFHGSLNFNIRCGYTFTVAITITMLGFLTNPVLADSNLIGSAQLKIPGAAQSASTMSVFSAVHPSPLMIQENPLGIATPAPQIAFSHSFWIADIQSNSLAFSYPFRKSAFGVGINYLRIPAVEVRDLPSEEPLAEVEPQFITAALAATHELIKGIRLGTTLKYLHEHIYTYSGNGMALDAGVLWNAPGNLDLCVQLRNLGSVKSIGDQKSSLPTLFSVGIIRPHIFVDESFDAAIGLNLQSVLSDGSTRGQVGAMITYRNLLKARAGLEQVGAITRKALGAGINFGRITVDYALLFMSEGFAHPHLFTISLNPKK